MKTVADVFTNLGMHKSILKSYGEKQINIGLDDERILASASICLKISNIWTAFVEILQKIVEVQKQRKVSYFTNLDDVSLVIDVLQNYVIKNDEEANIRICEVFSEIQTKTNDSSYWSFDTVLLYICEAAARYHYAKEDEWTTAEITNIIWNIIDILSELTSEINELFFEYEIDTKINKSILKRDKLNEIFQNQLREQVLNSIDSM